MSRGVRTLLCLARERTGTASILAAISFVALTASAALAIDVSSYYLQKRRLQSAADLAAIAAASDPANAQAAARAALASNGLAAATLERLEFGTYSGDPAIAAEARFVAGSGSAARLVASVTAPALLGRLFAMVAAPARAATTGMEAAGGVLIRARAIAAPATSAAFAIGSRLAQLDGGILNAVLGKMLGTTLSLSLSDYQALASAQIDLFAFSGALATRASLTGATFDSVAQGTFRLPDIIAAAATAAGGRAGQAGAADALGRVAGVLASGGSVPLAPVLTFGAYGGHAVTEIAPLTATVTALDLLTAVAQLANGTSVVEVTLPVNAPPLASAVLKIAIGARPAKSSGFATGRPAATVRTAQTRVLLTTTLAGAAPLASVSLPIVLDLASGAAQLGTVACPVGAASATSVTLAVTPSLADATIGAVSASDFANLAAVPPAAAAPLLTLLGGVTVTGRAHASAGSSTPATVTFSATEIAAGAKKTVSSTDLAATLLSSLIGDLRLAVGVPGFGFAAPPGLESAVATLVGSAAAPLDTVLNSVFAALGVGVGQADTWVTGTRCGGAVLVN